MEQGVQRRIGGRRGWRGHGQGAAGSRAGKRGRRTGVQPELADFGTRYSPSRAWISRPTRPPGPSPFPASVRCGGATRAGPQPRARAPQRETGSGPLSRDRVTRYSRENRSSRTARHEQPAHHHTKQRTALTPQQPTKNPRRAGEGSEVLDRPSCSANLGGASPIRNPARAIRQVVNGRGSLGFPNPKYYSNRGMTGSSPGSRPRGLPPAHKMGPPESPHDHHAPLYPRPLPGRPRPAPAHSPSKASPRLVVPRRPPYHSAPLRDRSRWARGKAIRPDGPPITARNCRKNRHFSISGAAMPDDNRLTHHTSINPASSHEPHTATQASARRPPAARSCQPVHGGGRRGRHTSRTLVLERLYGAGGPPG